MCLKSKIHSLNNWIFKNYIMAQNFNPCISFGLYGPFSIVPVNYLILEKPNILKKAH